MNLNLIKEFANYGVGNTANKGQTQANLRTSDGSDAGSSDTDVKSDVRFTMMRNIINRENGVNGADVQDYLERAHDLNDEVDTVAFGLETDDDEIIKVYVNAEQADEFEAEMSKLLGLEDDVEAAVNTLAQKFDIIDVVWPDEPEDGSDDEDPDADLSIEDEIDDGTEDVPPAEGEGGPESGTEEEPAEEEPKASVAKDGEEAEPDADPDADPDAETTDADSEEADADTEENEDDMEPVLDADGEPVLDADGNPKMRKKKELKQESMQAKTYSLDSIRSAIQPIFDRADKVESQEQYDKFLKSLGQHADVWDKYSMNTVHAVADKMHYNQKLDSDLASFLKKTVKTTQESNHTKGKIMELKSLSKLAEAKRGAGSFHKVAGVGGKVYVPGSDEDENLQDLHDALNAKANGADDVTYKGKKYNRTGPKNATSKPGKWKLVKESYEPEEGGLGSKFLDRVIVSEAAGEELALSDTVLKGLRARLKKPYEKKTVELMSLCGVLGRYVDDIDGLGDGIRAGADALRRGGRLQKAFNSFYDGMKSLSSGTSAPVAEAKRGSLTLKRLLSVLAQYGLPASAGEESGALATALRRTANKIDKTSDVEASLVALTRALGLSMGEVNEQRVREFADDRASGGNSGDTGWWIMEGDFVADGPYDSKREAEDYIKIANKLFKGGATAKFGTVNHETRELMKESKLDEAFPEANDAFIEAAVNMMKALGLPQANIDFRGTQAYQAIRARRQSLNGPAQLANRITRLIAMIDGAVRKGTEPAAVKEGGSARSTGNFRLDEAFGELEALTSSDMKQFNLEEPANGPAMFAPYQGSGNHDETVLVVGVDPDADTDRKSLKVSIANPWDGVPHSKSFENTADGYKAALQYANMLRSANLRTGGRPKGWKN